jgi:hypothetical protein
MGPQQFDIRASFAFTIVVFSLVLGVGVPAVAQDASLQGAVEMLREGQYAEGLAALDALEASADPRVDYYRGFALEKLGKCDAARSAYRQSRSSATNPRLQQVASDALEGFQGRCVSAADSARSAERPAASPASTSGPSSGAPLRGSGRVGWKVFGWTSAILGGITLVAIPIKSTLENQAFQRTAPYFDERYGCEVSGGEIDGGTCDKAALADDPIYEAYRENRKMADRAGRYMLIGGTTLAGVGVATLVTVALTRPSAPVQWSLVPTSGGAQVGAVLRF